MRAFSKYVVPIALFTPSIASAQSLQTISSLVSALVNYAIGIMIGLAILGFGYGVIRTFFVKDGDQEKRKIATGYMIKGIIAIAVLLSIYGLVRVLQNTLGLGNNTLIPAPSIGQLQITQQ